MPRTRALGWSELKIGLLALLALTLTATLIFFVGGQGGFPWQVYRLTTRFDNVQGLKEGALVRVAGVEAGSVRRISFSNAQVEVEIQLQREMQPRVTTESRAEIGSLSLLGEPTIDITAAAKGDPLPEGGFIQASPGAAQIRDVTESASVALQQLNGTLQDMRAGKGTIGRLLTDEALYKEMQALVATSTTVTRDLSRGRGTLGRLLQDPKAYEALQSSLGNLETMLKRINSGEGSLGRLVNDEAFGKSLTTATSNLEALTGRLNRGEGTAGRLLQDEALYNRLTALTDRLNDLTTRLNQGEGTMGQLLRDRQLYENMNQAVSELRSLVADIRKDPRRFLNVRVSIF